MSMIQSSWVLVGWRSLLIAGLARCRTSRSMTYKMQARAMTASPIHSRLPARGGMAVGSSIFTVAPPRRILCQTPRGNLPMTRHGTSASAWNDVRSCASIPSTPPPRIAFVLSRSRSSSSDEEGAREPEVPEDGGVEAIEPHETVAADRDHGQAGRDELASLDVLRIERERGLPVGPRLDEAASARTPGDDRVTVEPPRGRCTPAGAVASPAA